MDTLSPETERGLRFELIEDVRVRPAPWPVPGDGEGGGEEKVGRREDGGLGEDTCVLLDVIEASSVVEELLLGELILFDTDAP
jgi:hypothetical protein